MCSIKLRWKALHFTFKMSGKKVLPPHKKPANAEAFLASLSPIERKLQELAEEKLESSYFMEKTSAYKKWLASVKKS